MGHLRANDRSGSLINNSVIFSLENLDVHGAHHNLTIT